MEPAVAVEPEEARADPTGDPGVVGREEGVVRKRQLQLQLDLPLPPRPTPPGIKFNRKTWHEFWLELEITF